MRKELLTTGSLLAVSLTIAAAQQTTPAPQPSMAMQAERTESLVLIGCLRPAESVLGQSEQTAGSTPNPTETVRVQGLYVLTEVEPSVSTRPPVPPGAPQPPSPKTVTTSAHNTYYVAPKDESVKLGDHVNHRVQITGTLRVTETPGAPASMPSEGSKPTEQTGIKPAGDKSSTLIVSQVTMISAACSTQR